MCIYMYIFRMCSRGSSCANYLCFRVILYAFVAVIVLQIDPCVFRWHARFVICIVVSVLCIYLCRLGILATHALFVSFLSVSLCCLCSLRFGIHVGFGIVSVHCVLFLLFVIATVICICLCRCGVACFFSSQTVLDVNSYPGICAIDAFALHFCLLILIMF